MNAPLLSPTLIQQSLQQQGAKHLVLACSGGLDSMVLLDLLASMPQRQQFSLQVVYINHGLHPDAAEWGALVEQQCQQHQLSFNHVKVQVAKGDSVESAARDARYQALAAFVTAADSYLLTAHHADDQVETLLLALKRGAGAAGLSGMAACRPFANGHLLRPLLDVSRQQLAAYAQARQLDFVEDSSNQDLRFDRNFLRHQITPLLSARWPAFVKTAARSMQQLAQLQQLADELAEQGLQQCLVQQRPPSPLFLTRPLSICILQSYPMQQQQLIVRRWLSLYQLNPSQQWLQTLQSDVIAAKADAMPQLQLAQYQLKRFNGCLYLLMPRAEPAAGHYGIWDGSSSLNLPLQLGTLQLSSSEQNGAVAFLRQPVDVVFGQYSLLFKPAGQPTKPLKQWLKLWQLAPWQRNVTPLLLANGQVLAVAGQASAISAFAADSWLSWQLPEPH
ncbi:tRNA lysidine(34) synthetase TilS [Arsukibacterium sp.]|uniref:tRNA lysidine(34) synthetase TilS n=1 Tax=Arsukibacterium sp. TaxID=1977258 RepID=UPI002FD8E9F1